MLRGAAAALHASFAGADDDVSGLRRALRRSRRREQVRAAALVLPLFIFLAACSIVFSRWDSKRLSASMAHFTPAACATGAMARCTSAA